MTPTLSVPEGDRRKVTGVADAMDRFREGAVQLGLWVRPTHASTAGKRKLVDCARSAFTPRLPTQEARFGGNRVPLKNPSSQTPLLSCPRIHRTQIPEGGGGLRCGLESRTRSNHCRRGSPRGHMGPRSPCHPPISLSLDQPSDLRGDLLWSPHCPPEKNCPSSGDHGLE